MGQTSNAYAVMSCSHSLIPFEPQKLACKWCCNWLKSMRQRIKDVICLMYRTPPLTREGERARKTGRWRKKVLHLAFEHPDSHSPRRVYSSLNRFTAIDWNIVAAWSAWATLKLWVEKWWQTKVGATTSKSAVPHVKVVAFKSWSTTNLASKDLGLVIQSTVKPTFKVPA